LTFNASEILKEQYDKFLSNEENIPVLFKIATEIIATAENNNREKKTYSISMQTAHFFNTLRTLYAKCRGLDMSIEYSHFDQNTAYPKAYTEFKTTIEDILNTQIN
jgi:hypothetical protein